MCEKRTACFVRQKGNILITSQARGEAPALYSKVARANWNKVDLCSFAAMQYLLRMMYIPKSYRQEDPTITDAFIRENAFATLINWDGNTPFVVHIPMQLQVLPDGSKHLEGHVARMNPIWQTFQEDREVLAIFIGPHTYISPRWYSHINVPTWNYMVAHVYGKPRIVTDREEFFGMLKRLVDHYERGSGYTAEGLPGNILKSEMDGIVGFKIRVERVETSFKLSQNRNSRDHQSTIDELRKRGDESSVLIAKAMSGMRMAGRSDE
jgi:transcriptional regulator